MKRRDRDKRAAALRKRLLAQPGARLAFDFAGVTCPACGYVFDKGFSRLNGDPKPGDECGTLCTRCLVPLILRLDTGILVQAPADQAEAIRSASEPHYRLLRDMILFRRETLD